MRLGRTALAILLQRNVVELRFIRRHAKFNHPPHRRMLCTNDKVLLLSAPGKMILNFERPIGSLPYDAGQHNLVITYDIMMQNWRAIPCESVEVIAVVKTNPPSHFWDYFMKSIAPMSGMQKLQFNDK